MDKLQGKRVMICVFVDEAETIFTTTDDDSNMVGVVAANATEETLQALHAMARALALFLPSSSAGYHAHRCQHTIEMKYKELLDRMANPTQFPDADLPF